MRSALLFLILTAAATACFSAVAAEPGFSASLAQAQGHMDSGEYDRAFELLRKLQVDHPDSGLVGYGLGKALYARAQHQETLGAKDAALASFAEAEAAFGRAASDKDARVALEAAFAGLNAGARKAMLIPADQKYGEAVSGLRAAVAGYEQFLREHPGHGGAQKNLDHCRLKLKALLQNPPSGEQKEDEKQKPPEDNQKQPVVFFMNAGTEIPKARARAEGNQLELVVPEGEGAKP